MQKHAIVIGAGIAGLASSIRLAVQGYRVSLFDANPYAGGKLTQIHCQGYRFDAGPSLFTLPQLVDELFELAGYKPSDFFRYERLSTLCHYFWEDGVRFEAPAEPEAFIEAIHEQLGVAKSAVRKRIEQSALLYERLSPLFMERSLHQPGTFFNSDALKAYSKLHQFDFFRTMHKANETLLEEPHAVQLFNRYATYNGSDPYQTPATLNIIPHLEMGIGAYFPEGGMHKITEALVALAKKLDVNFRMGEKVDEILLDGRQVSGVRVGNERVLADVVVSNADMVTTYRKLLPASLAPEKLLAQPKSSSALIFYWGIEKEFPELDVHNIFFSKDYRHEFEQIFRKGSIGPDPTVYVNITSKRSPADAPEGCENWFVMINVPNNQGQEWDKMIDKARDSILSKLSRILGQDIASLIACEEILDPRLIQQRTSSWQGALYGNSSNNKFAAFLRHANKSNKVEGLYFCGGSVHPGGGIPLCLLSAKVTASLVPQLPA